MMNILILLGKRAVGKTSLAQQIKLELGIPHIEMSVFLKRLRTEYGMESLRLRDFVEHLRKTDNKTLAIHRLIKEYDSYQFITITGIRHIEELNHIKALFDVKNIFIIYLKVNFISRLLRVMTRKERSSIIEFIIEEFYSIKWNEYKLQNNSCYVLHNTSLTKSINKIKEILLCQ